MSPLAFGVGSNRSFGIAKNSGGGAGLYAFVNATFTSGGQAGNTGPSYAQAVSGLSGTSVDGWKNNTAYFNTSSGILLWTVPVTATYRLELKGGDGGGNVSGSFFPADPGEGATIITNVSLVSGTILNLVVGQTPTGSYSNNGTAGGGGSWIYTGSIGGAGLIAVAGGGGGWGHGSSANTGGNGLGGNNASDGDSRRVASSTDINGKLASGTGSTNGIGYGGGTTGGNTSYGGSGGGAGWLSSGTSWTGGFGANGGDRFTGGTSTLSTAVNGGWGGGGGGGGNGIAGGGGGGYTGGPAANGYSTTTNGNNSWGNAGGGGSYWTGSLVSATAGRDGGGTFLKGNASNGYITITLL